MEINQILNLSLGMIVGSIVIYFVLKQQYQAIIKKIKAEVESLESKLRQKEIEYSRLEVSNSELEFTIDKLKKANSSTDFIGNDDQEAERKTIELKELQLELNKISSEIGDLHKHEYLKECGHFHYRFNFESVRKYEDALHVVKLAQKQMIIDNKAFMCNAQGLIGSPIMKNLEKLTLLAFNNGVDLITRNISLTNYDSCINKVEKLFERINNFLASFDSYISSNFYSSKIKELTLSLEYQEERKKIKDEQDDLKKQIREEQKELLDAEKARDEAIKREEELEVSLNKAKAEIQSKNEIEKEQYLSLISKLENELKEAHANSERAISNAQITSEGHVYIISNIGSFGENVFKIGMTRRSEPLDRVKELGDASVPFKFDVHALIHNDNARKLESDLHKYFDDKRVNQINKRKEFFNVPLSEIEDACKELGVEIKLTKFAEALEYRQSNELENEVA